MDLALRCAIVIARCDKFQPNLTANVTAAGMIFPVESITVNSSTVLIMELPLLNYTGYHTLTVCIEWHKHLFEGGEPRWPVFQLLAAILHR